MKGIISILLTLLLLMNALGYYGIFFGLQYHNSVSMVKTFDEGTYDESKEIHLRFPITIPYNSESPYQRVDGNFEYEGEFYRLIKQRFVSDTLEVVLIKDDRHREIQEQIVKHSKQNDSSKSTVDFIKDYLIEEIGIARLSEGWQRRTFHLSLSASLLKSSLQLESPPPRLVIHSIKKDSIS